MASVENADEAASRGSSGDGRRRTAMLNEATLPVTIDEAIEEVGIGRTQWMLLAICGLTFMSDAAEVTFLSFMTEQLRCEWGLTGAQETSVAQAVFVGMIIGAPIWGYAADKIGRRRTFLVSSVVICSFGFGTALCQDLTSLLVVRTIVGFGVSGLPVGFDILAEALPTHGRGTFLLYIEFFWTLGSIFVNICAWLTLETMGWQVFTMLAAIPTLVASVAAYCRLPESPRWLVEVGRREEALVIINQWAEANKCDRRFCEITEVRKEHHKVGGITELFTRGKLRRTTLLMLIVWFGFGLAYYGVVTLLPRIFKDKAAAAASAADGTVVVVGNGTTNATWYVALGANWSSNASAESDFLRRLGEDTKCKVNFDFQAISLSSFSEILGVVLALFMIDSLGRTWTQGVFYVLGAAMAVILGFRTMDLNILMVVACIARLALMAASCATWVHTPELFPTSVRAEAHALLNLVSKVGATFSQYLISDMFSQVFCGCTMAAISLAAGVAAMMLTETAGVDLSNMSEISSDVGTSDGGADTDDLREE